MNAHSIMIASLIALIGVSVANVGTASGQQTTAPAAQMFAPPTAAELDRLGMQKLAEITAMSRHNETCPEVPREWSAALIILLMKNPPAEEEVEAQEHDTLALRSRIGRAKWCELYAVEMQEAYLIFQMLLQRKSP
ncbi:MAG TPA: hypothetical protein VMU69_03615 [Bradyrhizobium sp.]|nr:hypothetical protein [Bradyrhizobium sp.]